MHGKQQQLHCKQQQLHGKQQQLHVKQQQLPFEQEYNIYLLLILSMVLNTSEKKLILFVYKVCV